MESNSEVKEAKFSYKGHSISYFKLIILKGNTQEMEINIVINTIDKKNYINVNFLNQLLIPKSSIGERKKIVKKSMNLMIYK